MSSNSTKIEPWDKSLGRDSDPCDSCVNLISFDMIVAPLCISNMQSIPLTPQEFRPYSFSLRPEKQNRRRHALCLPSKLEANRSDRPSASPCRVNRLLSLLSAFLSRPLSSSIAELKAMAARNYALLCVVQPSN